MKHLFLYRLFQHSKTAFAFIILFVIGYTIVFTKKMDMLFYPYNSMFSIDFTKDYTATTYAVRINGDPVKITDRLYWKKDFLEESITNYCKYLQYQRNVFLDDYLHTKIADSSTRSFFLQRLTPERKAAKKWPYWYCSFAGYAVPQNATIALMKYTFSFSEGKALITNSASIYQTNLP